MKENYTQDEIPYQLILDELNGNLSNHDRAILEKWKAEAPEHMDIYQEIVEISRNAELLGEKKRLDTEKSWQKFSALAFKDNETPDHKVVKLKKVNYLRWSAAAVLLIGILVAINFWKNSGEQLVQTRKKERYHLILPDGSEVILNQNSSLSYNKRDFSMSRKVKLSHGEAYFNVKHNPKNPFSIQTGDLRVMDLGTSFNLNIEPGSVTVIVNSGKVAMEYKGIKNRVMLDPQDKGVLDRATKAITKSKNEDINYRSWYDKTLHYKQSPLEVVSRDLEKIYGTKIIFQNGELRERRLTAYFKQKSIEEIMQIIGTSLNLTVVNTNGGFTLTNP
ncbi:FecR family protein [Pedobacter sp. SG908]|uniref:FecR family protein n=1 Tax=Pedobacter sp. SG908 TaxID=2587135 RepID=UPI00142102F3|nr:FecR family protein [Pedobacter sp. SG908]NII83221.1 ferric-dicitrate binding protein FerR (iron transport regulator) [Pedobacter sp. SG908]